MKKIENYIIKNWLWLSVGLILTKFAVDMCYEQRGRFCLGGEWLIVPVILMASHLIPAISRDFADVFRKEDLEDAGWFTEVRRRMARQRSRHNRRRCR